MLSHHINIPGGRVARLGRPLIVDTFEKPVDQGVLPDRARIYLFVGH